MEEATNFTKKKQTEFKDSSKIILNAQPTNEENDKNFPELKRKFTEQKITNWFLTLRTVTFHNHPN